MNKVTIFVSIKGGSIYVASSSYFFCICPHELLISLLYCHQASSIEGNFQVNQVYPFLDLGIIQSHVPTHDRPCETILEEID